MFRKYSPEFSADNSAENFNESDLFRRLVFGLTFFILIFACSCPSQAGGQNDFYRGLLISDNEEKAKLFEKALTSRNEYIRQAAAAELAVLMHHGVNISARTANYVRREATGWWASAFDVTRNINKENALSFLFSFEQNSLTSFNEARSYVLQECEKNNIIFNEYEAAAMDGHYAVSRLRYVEALAFFRSFMIDNRWPEQMPEIFFKYPNLINDLGRAFQYTSSGNEGLVLFLQWESSLPQEIVSASDDIRYRLLFFAARVARRMGQNTQAFALFEQALALTPDSIQRDACIWYLLDISLAGTINNSMEHMKQFVPLITASSTINDIMERHLHRLVSAQAWGRIIETYDIIKDTESIGFKTGFAWVIARAIEEDYLTAEEINMAALAANADILDSSAYMQIAYNASNTLFIPTFYYRMQSAISLDLPFIEFTNNVPADNNRPSDALQFLLGFFENDAVNFAIPYVRLMERSLTPAELRAVSGAFDELDMYTQSMRLISNYINNEGYVRNRRDLELMYPRPYLELVETNAERFNIAPSLLFGLIRQESAFQRAVVSRAGAVGLMQLMPATAREQADIIIRRGGPNFYTANNILDSTNPEANIYIGTHYYHYLINRFNNDQVALMSYNGGPTRVGRWLNESRLPIDLFVETAAIYETRDYGRRIPALAAIYEALYYK